MQSRYSLLILLAVCALRTSLIAQDLDQVRHRMVTELLRDTVIEDRVAELLLDLSPAGRWPDIDYRDTSRTGFDHSRHLGRLVELARAYRKPGTPYTGDSELRAAIARGLDDWLTNDYTGENWWDNQIGTPRQLVHILLLYDDALTERQRELAAPIMGRATLEAWGARPGGDLIKIAGILGEYALFTHDTATLRTVVTALAGEIQFAEARGTPEDLRGMQVDYSFQHRDDRVTSILSYGLGYADAFASWAERLAGTSYALPQQATRRLVDYYLDGISRSAAFGTYPDPGAMNRGLSRPGALTPYGPELPLRLLQATDYREEELRTLVNRRRGTASAPPHPTDRAFWTSSYHSHQQPDYFSSVRMYSRRNHSTEEPYNREGLLMHHLADGSNFLIRDGQEYFDIFPLWDWQKIPGTTAVQHDRLPPPGEVQQRGLTDFVGGASDGRYGVVGFDFVSPLDSLAARKSWFFFAEEYVCLGAGIQFDHPEPVLTTLDQRYLEGAVIVGSASGAEILPTGTHSFPAATSLWHDSVGYLFPAPVALTIMSDEVGGAWTEINQQSRMPKGIEMGSLLRAWIDHGSRPQSAAYAYVVVPGIDSAAFSRYTRDSPTILVNRPDQQAVHHAELALTACVFYAPVTLHLTDGSTLRAEQPAVVLIDHGSKTLTVADPTQQLEVLEFTLSGAAVDQVLRVDLPGGEHAGQSVTVSYK